MLKYLSVIALVIVFSSANRAVQAEGAASAVTDPVIAHIVVTANSVDVEAAKLALKMGTDKEIKKFANWMATGHTSVNHSAGDLAKKLNVTPMDNDTSKSLKKGGDENLAALKKLKGKDFDKAYIHHEVAYHQAVIDAINNVLLPNVKNAELKALLEKTAPVLVGHMEKAKEIDAKL